MSSPSNLYAEKIYAEQPIALWSLDDDCTFASFFSDSQLLLSGWTNSGGTLSAQLPATQDPFPQILDTSFVSLSSTAAGPITITSPATVTTSSNFSAGLWVNPQSGVSSVKFTVGSLPAKTFDISATSDAWLYLGNVFEVASPVSAESFEIEITFSDAGLVYLNGFSIGKNQEFFGTRAVGNQLSTFDHGVGVEAFQYGTGENSGWYLGNATTKELYAKNFSTPLVYGSDTSTVLYANPTGPSLMVPGMGFLNNSGSKQNISFEAWLRVRVDGNTQVDPFRILGPIASSDGVYVYGQHLILKIDGKTISHYVGEWFRPMLLNLEYTVDQARLFINGEVVGSVDLDDVAFPEKEVLGVDQDFIGFYVGDGVDFIEVDCVAVYPYKLAPTILKRRFGFGQAVSLPSEIETAYSGNQIGIDYTFAGYSADYAYPRLESWSSSSTDSVYVDRSIMGSPKFEKPELVLLDQEVSLQQWEDQVEADNILDGDEKPFIKISPGTLSDTPGYLYLRSIRQQYLAKPTAIFVAGKAESTAADVEQVIFKIQNKETLDSVSAILSGTSIDYVYNIFGEQGSFGLQSVNIDGTFVAGIDINTYASSESSQSAISRFMRGIGRYSIFVGGDYVGSDQDIKTTFSGKIYSFGMSSSLNYIKNGMSSLFQDGIAKPAEFDTFYGLSTSYKVSMLKQTFNEDSMYSMNVSSQSYWQDYLPLSKFAKLSTYEDGSSDYLADMIQFSIDAEHSRVVVSDEIDQSNSDIRTYVHFIKASDVDATNLLAGSYTDVNLSKTKVVDARSEWSGKRFEVVDGTVIYVPQSNFPDATTQKDFVMVTSVEIRTRSVEFLPVKIRTLEYASQTFNRSTTSSFNKDLAKKIGTRTQASDIYMFSEIAGEFDYSAYNPVAISKTMSPYLYMTDKSGIKVLDSYSIGEDRGIYIPLNIDAAPEYYISILSMSMLFNDDQFPSEMTIAEIYDDSYGKLRITLEASSNDTSKASLSIKSLVGATWTPLTNVEFYVNGVYVVSPELVRGEWSTVGILFVTNPINASSLSSYKIELIGSVLINNIAYFQKRPEELGQQITPQEWNDYDDEQTWDWDPTVGEQAITKDWSEIYAIEQESRPTLTPDTIFDVYSGTNKIISVESEDISGITFNNFSYDIIQGVSVATNTTVSP